MSGISYTDPEGVKRSGTFWANAPSASGFVRCMYLRRDGLWIVIGTATKDRKVKQIAATERPGQTLTYEDRAFHVTEGPSS